ncbi:MAG: mandelate racemase/muconate lactonizing enzyme family protein [Rhizobiales bacterium]|nr:mandelate racemase/muconate lactonizing enzyme family protein [Hyphomicrobiales bacterium]NRB12768.1 mandelate racemase/muconate lactonizing enzyme family protein [Hyphomicrobiales bacterium]
MAKIVNIEVMMVDLMPKVKRTDAIQSFVKQETPIVIITDADGVKGCGYSYTIGTGGSSVIHLIVDHLAPLLIGKDARYIEKIWHDMLFHTHATAVGAITSLAMAAIDIALWDLKSIKANNPLYIEAGGAKDEIQLYSTEGGWLHIETEQLVDDALNMQAQGFKGAKIKIGKQFVADDEKRLKAVREAVGDHFNIMVDANQSFSLSEAKRRDKMLTAYEIGWFEEPLPADDILAHQKLTASSGVPIAVGESIYSLSQFKDYLALNACDIIQVDVARIGGITPWLKVAHMAEAFNVSVCPHFLMELHVSLCCAINNAPWLEYIPQLDAITHKSIDIQNGIARPSKKPGLGIDWDFEAIAELRIDGAYFNIGKQL